MCPSSTSSSERPAELGEDDGSLFPRVEGNGAPASRAARLRLAAISAFFVLVCAGVGVVDAAFPVEAPALEGAERRELEALRRQAKLSDGSRMQLLEQDLRLTSRVRQVTGPRYAFALFRTFHEAHHSLLVGPNEWLFLEARLGVSSRSDEEWVDPALALVAATVRRLENRGVRTILVPVPRKAVIAAAELPPGIDPRPGIEAAFLAGLARRGVESLDLSPQLQRLELHEAYQPWDTHWARLGRLVAAKQMALGVGVSIRGKRHSRLKRVPGMNSQAALLRTAGITLANEPPDWIEVPKQTAIFVQNRPPELGELDSQPSAMTRYALSGSSFSTGTWLTSPLEHFLGERVWQGSKGGLGLLESCRKFLLETSALGLPEVLWIEVPLHHTFELSTGGDQRVRVSRELAPLFAQFAPGPLSVLLDAEVMGQRAAFARSAPAGAIRFPDGLVASSNDGIVGLRLTRDSAGPGTTGAAATAGSPAPAPELTLQSFGFSLRFTWPSEQAEVVLPLLGLEHRPGPRSLQLITGDLGQAVRVELVTDLDLEAPVAVGEGAVREADGSLRIEFTGEPEVSRLGGLVLECGKVQGRLRNLLVAVESTAGEVLEFQVSAGSDCTMVLGIGALEGRALRTVRVSPAGPEPGPDELPPDIGRVVLARQARP